MCLRIREITRQICAQLGVNIIEGVYVTQDTAGISGIAQTLLGEKVLGVYPADPNRFF